jgi:hypothetical protein
MDVSGQFRGGLYRRSLEVRNPAVADLFLEGATPRFSFRAMGKEAVVLFSDAGGSEVTEPSVPSVEECCEEPV